MCVEGATYYAPSLPFDGANFKSHLMAFSFNQVVWLVDFTMPHSIRFEDLLYKREADLVIYCFLLGVPPQLSTASVKETVSLPLY